MRRSSKLARAVVDTNLFIRGLIHPGGAPSALIAAWQQGAFVLLMSNEQRTELEGVLNRPRISERHHLSPQRLADFLLLVDTLGIRVPLRQRLPVKSRDPKDDHLLAAALGGKADYLVTADEDLLVLRDDPRLVHLKIVTVREFLDTCSTT